MEQLTPYGKRLTERLRKIGKDIAWLSERMYARDKYTTSESIVKMLTEKQVSKPRQAAVGIIISEEEQRQRLKKIAGIKEKRV